MKLGPEDTSRIANYEKNQADTYNLLQSILVKRNKIKEALALSERGRARALADIIQSKLSEFEKSDANNDDSQDVIGDVLEDALTESEDASDIMELVQQLNSTLVVYSVVTEFGVQSNSSKWIYIWVVTPGLPGLLEMAKVYFAKVQLTKKKQTVNSSSSEIDDKYVNSLCRSFGNLSVTEGQELAQGNSFATPPPLSDRS